MGPSKTKSTNQNKKGPTRTLGTNEDKGDQLGKLEPFRTNWIKQDKGDLPGQMGLTQDKWDKPGHRVPTASTGPTVSKGPTWILRPTRQQGKKLETENQQGHIAWPSRTQRTLHRLGHSGPIRIHRTNPDTWNQLRHIRPPMRSTTVNGSNQVKSYH